MAKNYFTPINLNGLELLNARLQNLASAPASPTAGSIYYDTALGFARVYSGGSWVNINNVPTYTDEQAQDAVAALIAAGTQVGIAVAYDDANNTLSFSIPNGAITTAMHADGSVTNVKIASGISADKLVDGSTNAYYTLAERSKLSGVAAGATANSTDANLRDRSTHTGTQSADTITNGTTNGVFTQTEKTKLAGIATGATAYSDTNARANRLDQFAAPTAAVSFNSQLITNVATPVSATDAATKGYVDSTAQGLDFKASVIAATTANITLTGLQTIDGYTTLAGDRILVKNQTSAATNGIYIAASGAWTRSADADTTGELSSGTLVYVEQGTVNDQQQWVITTTGTITLGTTAITWTQFSSASVLTAGAGLSPTGNTFNVGQGTGIIVGTDTVSIDTSVVTRKAAFSIGNGSLTSFTITHNFANQDVIIQVYTNGGNYDEVEVDVQRTSTNTATILFATAPAANAYRVVVMG